MDLNKAWEQVAAIFIAITGVAIVAVLVSKKSDTAAVIQASGSAFGNSLGVAVSPVTGNQYTIDLSYPGQSGMMLPQMGGYWPSTPGY
jgi:hypothetical protein